MGIADEQVLGKYGTGVQLDTPVEYNIHQFEIWETQGMGGDAGELGPDRPDEGYQWPHLPEIWHQILLHWYVLGPMQIPEPTSRWDDRAGVPWAVDL